MTAEFSTALNGGQMFAAVSSPAVGAGREAGDIAAPTDPILVRVFDYWNEKRGRRIMPARADLDPLVELRGLASHLILYDVVEPGRRLYRVRLVGQVIVDFAGVNSTGKLASETMTPQAAERVQETLSSVVSLRAPRFRAGYAYWHRDKSYHRFQSGFLPLSSHGRIVDKILGVVAFTVS